MIESKYIDKKTANLITRDEMREIGKSEVWPPQYWYVYSKMFPEDARIHGQKRLQQVIGGQLVNPVIVKNVRKMYYELVKIHENEILPGSQPVQPEQV